MSEGEKMVWAAAFALEYQRCRDEVSRVELFPDLQYMAGRAARFADGAVSTLGFAPHDGLAPDVVRP